MTRVAVSTAAKFFFFVYSDSARSDANCFYLLRASGSQPYFAYLPLTAFKDKFNPTFSAYYFWESDLLEQTLSQKKNHEQNSKHLVWSVRTL